MQQQNTNHTNDKHFFESIPQNQRSQYRIKMLTIKQSTQIFDPKRQPFPTLTKWNFKGDQLNYHSNEVNQNPKAIIVYFHGMNSHGGSSGYLLNHIAKNCNINAYALDFKNFGRSASPSRGYVESLEVCLQQAEAFIDMIIAKLQNNPKIFISGQSFGGTICFKLTLKSPKKFNGIIFLGPGLREVPQSSPFMKKIAKCIGFLFPTMQTVEQTYQNGTRYNLEKIIKEDPYNYTGKVIPGSVRTILNSIQQVSKEYQLLNCPYILFQGGVDKLVDPFAPIDLERLSPSKDKTTIYYKDCWHALSAEPQIQEIMNIASKWISQRI